MLQVGQLGQCVTQEIGPTESFCYGKSLVNGSNLAIVSKPQFSWFCVYYFGEPLYVHTRIRKTCY